jgi:uncharacterized protein (UPF0261 family)
MRKSVVLVGTLDTKGDQLVYLKEQIERWGHRVVVVDMGVLGEPALQPTVDKHQVAAAVGTTIQELIALNGPALAMSKMAEGVAKVMKSLWDKREFDGVVGVGGSMGTSAALAALKGVPLGVPKLLVTTMAYHRGVTPDMTGGLDVMMIPWTGGLWGLNSISKEILEVAAGAISGAAQAYDRSRQFKKIVGVTSIGGSVAKYMDILKPALEQRGYEVAVFHAMGMSGRMYERTIREGRVDAVLDLSAGVELLNEVCDGVCSAGPDRLLSAGKMGIPQVVSPGAIEAFHWGHDRALPPAYQNRPRNWHNDILLTMGSTVEEMGATGELLAKRLNESQGPAAVVIPMKGLGVKLPPPPPDAPVPDSSKEMEWKALIRAQLQLTEPGLRTFKEELTKHLKPEVKVVALDAGFNDPAYVQTVLGLFDQMVIRR